MNKQHENRVRDLCHESEIGSQLIVEFGFLPEGWSFVERTDAGDIIVKVE